MPELPPRSPWKLPLEPRGPRGLALRCAAQGHAAGAAGELLAACPYGPDRDYSRRAWVRGWVSARTDAGLPVLDQLEAAVDEDAPAPRDT